MKRCGMCKILLLDDAAEYCDKCKAKMSADARPADAFSTGQELSAPTTAYEDELAGSTLRLGIMGLVFSHVPFLSVPGFVLSLLACARAGSYERTFGALKGRAKVGSVLGKVGRAVGLAWNIAIAVYFTFGKSAGL